MRRSINILATLLTAALLAGGCGFLGGGNVFDLSVGDCFDDTEDISGGEVSDVPIVDCSEPHDNEVFHTFEVDDGEFPGDDGIVAEAQEQCVPAFEEYVGTDYASSRLDVFPITPTEKSWEGGDREIVCALYDVELAKLEGSMKDSGE